MCQRLRFYDFEQRFPNTQTWHKALQEGSQARIDRRQTILLRQKRHNARIEEVIWN